MFKCLDCETEFEENDAGIWSYGTGRTMSKLELLICAECESANIKDLDTGKIQTL